MNIVTNIRTVYNCVCVCVTPGLVWAEVKQLWDEGARAYIQDMWNILDFITNSLYIATFTLKLVAYLRVSSHSQWLSLCR